VWPWNRLSVGTGIGCLNVDDVAQESLAVVQFVAPNQDCLESSEGFRIGGNHRPRGGFDALAIATSPSPREQIDERISRK